MAAKKTVSPPKNKGGPHPAPKDEVMSVWHQYERLNYNAVHTAAVTGLHRDSVAKYILRAQEEFGAKRSNLGQPGAKKAKKVDLPAEGIKRYILTCAQNNTRVHQPTWQSLLQLAAHYGAEMKVSTFTYIPTSEGSQKRGKEIKATKERWYDKAIEQYISDEYEQLAPKLVWCGHSNTLPTAVTPLSGTESLNGRNSGVWPHVTTQMTSVATMHGSGAKFNYTTGAVTVRNYIHKRAGLRADFHHTYGAALVEVTPDGAWWVRQLSADSEGTIYDLGICAAPTGVRVSETCEALVYGDIHEANIDPHVKAGTWGEGRLVDELRPKLQVFHDLIDFESGSHHSRKDPHERYRKMHEVRNLVQKEVADAGVFLDVVERSFAQNVVISSNHNEHLNKWLKETDWRDDLPNAEYNIEGNRAWLAAIRAKEGFDPLRWSFGYLGVAKFSIVWPADKSYVICKDRGGGIELGLHGDKGPNGSRGSVKNLARLGRKTIIGHSHTANIFESCWQVGTSSKLDMGYNSGPSSWSHTHCVVYNSGKRALITFWKGAYSAQDHMDRINAG